MKKILFTIVAGIGLSSSAFAQLSINQYNIIPTAESIDIVFSKIENGLSETTHVVTSSVNQNCKKTSKGREVTFIPNTYVNNGKSNLVDASNVVLDSKEIIRWSSYGNGVGLGAVELASFYSPELDITVLNFTRNKTGDKNNHHYLEIRKGNVKVTKVLLNEIEDKCQPTTSSNYFDQVMYATTYKPGYGYIYVQSYMNNKRHAENEVYISSEIPRNKRYTLSKMKFGREEMELTYDGHALKSQMIEEFKGAYKRSNTMILDIANGCHDNIKNERFVVTTHLSHGAMPLFPDLDATIINNQGMLLGFKGVNDGVDQLTAVWSKKYDYTILVYTKLKPGAEAKQYMEVRDGKIAPTEDLAMEMWKNRRKHPAGTNIRKNYTRKSNNTKMYIQLHTTKEDANDNSNATLLISDKPIW